VLEHSPFKRHFAFTESYLAEDADNKSSVNHTDLHTQPALYPGTKPTRRTERMRPGQGRGKLSRPTS
jgi:hypothetical protein